jgi:hypothetical protein
MAMALGLMMRLSVNMAVQAVLSPNGLDEVIRDLCGVLAMIKHFIIPSIRLSESF